MLYTVCLTLFLLDPWQVSGAMDSENSVSPEVFCQLVTPLSSNQLVLKRLRGPSCSQSFIVALFLSSSSSPNPLAPSSCRRGMCGVLGTGASNPSLPSPAAEDVWGSLLCSFHSSVLALSMKNCLLCPSCQCLRVTLQHCGKWY